MSSGNSKLSDNMYTPEFITNFNAAYTKISAYQINHQEKDAKFEEPITNTPLKFIWNKEQKQLLLVLDDKYVLIIYNQEIDRERRLPIYRITGNMFTGTEVIFYVTQLALIKQLAQ